MMKTIEIGKCLSEFPNGNVGKIVGTSGDNGVLTTLGSIMDAGGCGALNRGTLSYGKWYRIAIGDIGSFPSTAIVNIAKNYSSDTPSAQLFYISADGYSGSQTVTCIANSGKSVGKARVLYKDATKERVLLDIYISSLSNNDFYLSYSCNLGFTFQNPIEVSATPDAGYSVKEFTL